jgi:hypothetical protein
MLSDTPEVRVAIESTLAPLAHVDPAVFFQAVDPLTQTHPCRAVPTVNTEYIFCESVGTIFPKTLLFELEVLEIG